MTERLTDVDQLPSKERDIADELLEAVTVLDEPYHREAVAGVLGRAAGLIQRLRSDLEELHDAHDTLERKLDTCGLQCSATMKSLVAESEQLTRDCNDKDITIERLRTALTGISTCSTCEACRGAALRALGERTVEEINAAVDERLDRVERELAASMVVRCEHGNPIDPTGGYVCLKCFRAPSTTGEGQ